ncbi:MAG: ABC transporter permease [Clostridiales bacterium]|jgi:putative ABC transport system permease protein|nr:ABC transporter permease [Clostridiales bacterium]
MGIIIGIIRNILEEGSIYGIMTMGVYISYSVLKFPDLTVDGTFPLGMCVTAALISSGVNPVVACLIAALCGAVAGCVTGLLHVKLHIADLLSGILVMTAMWSVNLVITRGSAVVPFYNMDTIFNSGPVTLLPKGLYTWRVLIVSTVATIIVKIILDYYMKTKSGLLLRATGDNQQFVTSVSKNPGMMKIIGLTIGNACTALSGSILSQVSESANINSGTGIMVMGLASVIIGSSIFKKVNILSATTKVIIGMILYRACLAVAMQLGLPTNYLKMLMAAIFTVALVANNTLSKEKKAYEKPE